MIELCADKYSVYFTVDVPENVDAVAFGGKVFERSKSGHVWALADDQNQETGANIDIHGRITIAAAVDEAEAAHDATEVVD